MASLTDFNAHVIKVVEDDLTSTSQLTKGRTRDNEISTIFNNFFFIPYFLHQVFQRERTHDNFVLLDGIGILSFFHDVLVASVRTSHFPFNFIAVNKFSLEAQFYGEVKTLNKFS